MIGIIGAMEQETRSLLANMEDVVRESVHHLEYISGTISGQKVVLTQSGIGKVNSALATAFMIDRYQPELVINTGSAGGLKAGLKMGDVLVAHTVAYHDVDATAFGYKKGQVPQMPAVYESEASAVKEIQQAIEAVGLTPREGLIVSSDSFIADPEAVKQIIVDFPEAGATEMEGASIAQACHVLGVPFVVVRAISDSADEEASISFDEFIEVAGKNSAEMVMAFLANKK
ncbi:5'-methylthioadenosine/adenosylhomocysteine nucleosidase [Jeotgalibaca caeni]|uniref:5'-methylthioadenosine/adenosylhomocysteine nucleosidase n=1 Tax=Jeotgalibaca caeni TaxID=3028623 RepID=UPI00237E9DF0|nr:5'-methylthioadenosine/adenosylhomocysteine nucleosidase [Jeotgalibaca caeni]MDE1547918.1 5'-methylthioadenosine/adenosylhomocysteine nucleosidase [Jeotgalibaca caeni]